MKDIFVVVVDFNVQFSRAFYMYTFHNEHQHKKNPIPKHVSSLFFFVNETEQPSAIHIASYIKYNEIRPHQVNLHNV